MAAFLYLYPRNHSAAYFLMPPRLWELGVGCPLYIFQRRFVALPDRLGHVLPMLISLALIGILFMPQASGLRATVLVVGLTAGLIAFLKKGCWGFRSFTQKQVVWIGLISYSLYLWHWGVLCISRWTIGIHWLSWPFQLALILLLSTLSFHFIENPMRRAAWGIDDFKTIAYALVTSVGGSLVLLAIKLLPTSTLYLGDASKDKNETVRSVVAGTPITLENCSWYLGSGPDLKEAIDKCTVGTLGNARKMFYVLGDSHASNLTGWMSLISHSRQFAARILFVNGQPVPPVPLLDYKDYINNDRAKMKNSFAKQQNLLSMTLSSVKPGDVIIIISNYLAGFFGQGPDVTSGNEREKALLAWIDKLKKLSDLADQRGYQVVLIGPLPRFRSSDKTPQNVTFLNCSAQWFRPELPKHCMLSRDRSSSLQETQRVRDAIDVVVAQSKNLYLFDPFPLFCDGSRQKCSNYKGSDRVFLDTNHLNARGSMILAPEFMKFLVAKQLI